MKRSFNVLSYVARSETNTLFMNKSTARSSDFVFCGGKVRSSWRSTN